MKPAEFVATQSVLSLMVDTVRIAVYAFTFLGLGEASTTAGDIPWGLVAAATAGALAGVLVGRAALPKMTLERLHVMIGGLLLVVGVALASGVI
jgi:uncharacterized membrane protein YfcA